MNLKDIQNKFHKELDPLYDKEEVNNFFFMLIENYYHVSRIGLAMEPQLSVDSYEGILIALDLLKKQQPIQYILGETEFYGLPFKVSEHTLIPRPETEELVEWIINHQPETGQAPLKILDVGTGSGCIAISLAKKLPNAEIFALDISVDALKIARHNAELNEVEVVFIEADILKISEGRLKINGESASDLKFDIIVSNPPYVREQEKQFMKPNVLDNEPHLALFVEDNDPLIFYKAITEFAVKNLKENGKLFFEINEFLGNDMIQLLVKHHFGKIELKQDMFKKDRMIKGIKN